MMPASPHAHPPVCPLLNASQNEKRNQKENKRKEKRVGHLPSVYQTPKNQTASS